MGVTQKAIDTHGPTAVYQAASKHMEGDAQALPGVGLQPESMGDVWRIQSKAYEQMPMQDRVEDQVGVASKLAKPT